MKHFCEKHPQYYPEKPPTYLCDGCWTIYFKSMIVVPRAPIKPTKTERSKKTYTRKAKHPKKHTD